MYVSIKYNGLFLKEDLQGCYNKDYSVKDFVVEKQIGRIVIVKMSNKLF